MSQHYVSFFLRLMERDDARAAGPRLIRELAEDAEPLVLPPLSAGGVYCAFMEQHVKAKPFFTSHLLGSGSGRQPDLPSVQWFDHSWPPVSMSIILLKYRHGTHGNDTALRPGT